MGAMDDLLAASEPVPKPEGPQPNRLVVEGPDGSRLTQPLPLPGGLTPEAWLAQLAATAAPGWATTARWTLAVAQHRLATPTPTQEWRPVATAGSL